MKKVTPKKELRAIACFKLVKSLLLLGTGAGLLALLNRDLAVMLEEGTNALHAGPMYNHAVHGLIAKLGVMDVKTLEELGVGTLAYGSLSLAEGIGADPLPILLAGTLAASCGFALPIATMPNTIAYGTGEVSVRQMGRAGLALDVVSTLIMVAAALWLVPLAF